MSDSNSRGRGCWGFEKYVLANFRGVTVVTYDVAIQHGKNGIHFENARRSVRPQLLDSENTEVNHKHKVRRQPRKVRVTVTPTISSLRSADEQCFSSDDGEYVLKPVSPAIWKQAENISHDLKSAQFIRLPIDFIPAESVLVYPYFTDHLLSFVQNYEIPLAQTKGILLSVLKALKELHGQDWVHTGIEQVPLDARTLRDR